MVHDACQSLLDDKATEEEEEFRSHLRRLTRENNVPRKRRVHTDVSIRVTRTKIDSRSSQAFLVA